MSDAVQLAVVASIAPTIAALGALFVSLHNSRKANETAEKMDTQVKKTDIVIEKAAEIHVLANDNLAKMTAALALANEKIQGMDKLLAEVVSSRHDVAVALSMPPPRPGVPLSPIVPGGSSKR